MMQKLQQQSGYFNRGKQTVAGPLAGKDQRPALDKPMGVVSDADPKHGQPTAANSSMKE